MQWTTFHDRLRRPRRRDEITESPKRIKAIVLWRLGPKWLGDWSSYLPVNAVYWTEVWVAEQEVHALWILGDELEDCLSACGDGWIGLAGDFPATPSPTAGSTRCIWQSQEEGQSAQVSWAALGLGIAWDCSCNQGISHSKLWSFRLLYDELNFRPKHVGYSETQWGNFTF